MEKIQKPFTFENPKAQKKLLDYETIRNTSYECKFPAYMHYGKGLKQEMCETVLYVETEGIHIAFCHFGKIYSSDITYETIERAVFKQEDFLIIRVRESGNIVLSVKDSIPQLKELLAEKNICFEEYWEEKQ